MLLSVVLMQHSRGLRVEHEELTMFLGGDEKTLFAGEDHKYQLWQIISNDELVKATHIRYFLLSIYYKGYSITTSAFFYCFFIIERVIIGRPFRFSRSGELSAFCFIAFYYYSA